MNTIDQSIERARTLRSQFVSTLIRNAINSLRRRVTENNPQTGGLATHH